MATTRSQRIGIWVIAVVMTVGTLFSFFVVIIANNNQKVDIDQQQKLQADMQKQFEQQAKEQAAQNAAASKPLEGYEAVAFDAASVKDLKVDTLKQGDGALATENSTVTANYFGWTADGKIFDSTNKNGTTKPIDFALNQVIKGWTTGLTGVKAGSTVKLTIPSAMAYGDNAGASGQPAGPLVFIVELKAVK